MVRPPRGRAQRDFSDCSRALNQFDGEIHGLGRRPLQGVSSPGTPCGLHAFGRQDLCG